MENKISKKLMKEFEGWSEHNKKYFRENKNFTSVVYMIGKNDKRAIMMVIFRNAEEKMFIRNVIKLMALAKAKAYFFASDTKLTRMSRDEQPEVYDALVQMLCCPDGLYQKITLHNGEGEPIKVDGFEEDLKSLEATSEWNAWQDPVDKSEINEEFIKKYNEFKKANPDLFKDIR